MSKGGWTTLLTLLASGGALVAFGAPVAAAAPLDDEAAWLFDSTGVLEIDLAIPQAGRDALAADPDEYVEGTFTVDDGETVHGPRPVGVRLKGNATFRTLAGKAAFKLKFNEFGGTRFFGLKRLTLNNMLQDASNVREVLAFELFDAAGVPAPRAGYAYVRVDGENFGLYANVETLDDVAIDKRLATTQHLYEGEQGADVVTGELDELAVEEGDDEDISDLEALSAALDSQAGTFSQRMAGHADLDEMTRMWAVEKYLGQWDGYSVRDVPELPGEFQPNNYFLHSDEVGVFSMLPWGLDQSMTRRVDFLEPGGRLWEQCRAELACREQLRLAVAQLPGLANALDLRDRAAELAAMLAPWQQLAVDPARREYSNAATASEVSVVREFLAVRPSDVVDPRFWDGVRALPGLEPDSAAPQTTIVDRPDRRIEARADRVRVKFRFASSEAGSSFECRRDGREWMPCTSPRRFRVGLGHHSLRVRAIDRAGNVDPTPARASWSVRRRGARSG